MRKLDEIKKQQAKEAFHRLLEHLSPFHPQQGNKNPHRCGAEVLARLIKIPPDTVRRWRFETGYVPLSKAAVCARVGRHMGLEITKEQLAPDLDD